MYNKDRGTYADTPKSIKSVRDVEVGDLVIEALREYNVAGRTTGYVFAQDNGEPINPTTITDWCDDFSKRHTELPHMNPHKFRHTYASLLAAIGSSIADISVALGHSNISVTSNTYTHPTRDAKHKLAQTFSALIE